MKGARMLPTISSSRLDRQLAYAVFRFTLGINILIHGMVRIVGPGAMGFASKTEKQFTTTPLPEGLTHAFLVVLPYAELGVGILITIGLFTRWALALGGLLIAALVFGTALRSDWTTVSEQMIYAIVYYVLLANRTENRYSLDALSQRSSTTKAVIQEEEIEPAFPR